MLKKGSRLNSILTGSCPRCHQDSMYVNPNPFHLSEVLKMKDKCSHCGLRYMIEPSFFYGAMYVSYGLNVLIGMGVFAVCFFGFKTDVTTTFISIIVSLTLLMPLVLRWSRNIYINLFVSEQSDQD
ncbi:DUF983 domain-containing protein [Flavobacterium magnum]|uniref:DUF983 domain-containing protein n=1 Tax=Flavobacterium magnum TaxID=2162713 RepID=A0A2S0RCH7_9FLAO|nr:DUF983 domain-containing protein [Flavobacterium magnum]AWA28801.1 DUF983 domain-containing protein [Flavobacterium magnum]